MTQVTGRKAEPDEIEVTEKMAAAGGDMLREFWSELVAPGQAELFEKIAARVFREMMQACQERA